MKTYQVTVKRGNEIRITYCTHRPEENEIFIVDGEKWTAVFWI